MAGTNQRVDVGGVSGNPCHETASAPTTRYSTSFEFKHSINSRKPLLKGIGVSSLSQFEEHLGPLLRSHLRTGKGVGRIGFFKGVKNTHHSLHRLHFTPARSLRLSVTLRERLNESRTSLLSWLILYNGFFATAHLVQNDVGGGLPDEGFGLFVPGCEPPVYGAFQFVD